VHIDGYIACVAHSTIATAGKETIEGRKADVICAAWHAADVALKLMRPGKTNQDVSEAIGQIATAYKCNPVEGVLSHEIRRFIIDGDRVIINKPTKEQKVETFTFSEGEAYTIDIVMSTGEGKTREVESRTTVYKRAPESAYSLKLKASRYVLNEISEKSPVLPFSLRLVAWFAQLISDHRYSGLLTKRKPSLELLNW
jgi:curved DNA binding protein